jgi:hypothetical protein
MVFHGDCIRYLNWDHIGKRNDGNPFRRKDKVDQFLVMHCDQPICEGTILIPRGFFELQLYLERAGEIT